MTRVIRGGLFAAQAVAVALALPAQPARGQGAPTEWPTQAEGDDALDRATLETLWAAVGRAPPPPLQPALLQAESDPQEEPSEESQTIAGVMGGILGLVGGSLAGVIVWGSLCEGEYCGLAGAKVGMAVGAVLGFVWARKAHRENPPTPPRKGGPPP